MVMVTEKLTIVERIRYVEQAPESGKEFVAHSFPCSSHLAGLIVGGALVWQGITASGNPDPTAPHLDHNAVISITGILVFREGLEAILVLSAITASLVK